jgi:hypothetical protein
MLNTKIVVGLEIIGLLTNRPLEIFDGLGAIAVFGGLDCRLKRLEGFFETVAGLCSRSLLSSAVSSVTISRTDVEDSRSSLISRRITLGVG